MYSHDNFCFNKTLCMHSDFNRVLWWRRAHHTRFKFRLSVGSMAAAALLSRVGCDRLSYNRKSMICSRVNRRPQKGTVLNLLWFIPCLPHQVMSYDFLCFGWKFKLFSFSLKLICSSLKSGWQPPLCTANISVIIPTTFLCQMYSSCIHNVWYL